MKKTFIILSLFLSGFCYLLKAQDNNLNQGNLYPFNDFFLNLDNLQKVTKEAVSVNNNFKNSGKYALRFSVPLWFEGYAAEAFLKNKKFELLDNDIIITNFTPGSVTKEKSESITKKGTSKSFLISTSHSVIYIKSSEKAPLYLITVYDEKGDVSHVFKLTHTMTEETNNEVYSYPFLNFFACSDDNLVYTSYDKNFPLTYLLDIKTGVQTTINHIVNGIIRNEGENEVIGSVEINEEKQLLKVNIGEKSWTASAENNYYDEAETLLKDSMLIVATYPKIATGANLSAYNQKTGKLLWKADVAQMNVGHSEYYNKVILSLYGNKIIMEGIEAGGKYLQIFDIKDGKRLFMSGIEDK